MIYNSIPKNHLIPLFPEFSYDCYPHTELDVIDNSTFLSHLELCEVLFWFMMNRRCHTHPFIAFWPHQPSYPASKKRCDVVSASSPHILQMLFSYDIPLFTKFALVVILSSSTRHAVKWADGWALIVQNPSYIATPSPYLSSFRILYADLIVYSVVSLSFHTHQSSFSSLILLLPISLPISNFWCFSQSNKLLLHPIFHTHWRLLFHSHCRSLSPLLEQIEKSLINLSFSVSPPSHLSFHNMISLPFPTSQKKLSSKCPFHPSNLQISFKSLHHKDSDILILWFHRLLQPPYFDSNTSFHKPLSSLSNRHIHFPKRATLNLLSSNIPSPPISFASQTFLHKIHATFLPSKPHTLKKFLCSLST